MPGAPFSAKRGRWRKAPDGVEKAGMRQWKLSATVVQASVAAGHTPSGPSGHLPQQSWGRDRKAFGIASWRRPRKAADEFGDDEGVGRAAFGRWRRRAGLLVAEESKNELRRALIAFRRAIDELRHRRLELGEAPFPPVFLRLDLFAERLRQKPAEAAGAPRPAARIAGLTRAEAGRPRRPALADPLFVLLCAGVAVPFIRPRSWRVAVRAASSGFSAPLRAGRGGRSLNFPICGGADSRKGMARPSLALPHKGGGYALAFVSRLGAPSLPGAGDRSERLPGRGEGERFRPPSLAIAGSRRRSRKRRGVKIVPANEAMGPKRPNIARPRDRARAR